MREAVRETGWSIPRLIAVTIILQILAAPATACTIPPTYDPYRVLKRYTREEIARAPEVIVEGVVERDKSGNMNDEIGVSRMHVDRVWKGDLGRPIVVVWNHSSDCTPIPPFGKRIRFGAQILGKQVLLAEGAIALTPERRALIESSDAFLWYGRRAGIDLPLHDPALDVLLVKYQAETAALKQGADSGDRAARMAYAAHLFDNNERHRSLAVYEALLQDNPSDLDLLLTLTVVRARVHPDSEPEATLLEVERKAPPTEVWQGKIARARFAATGRLTPGWKDWSDLERARQCEVSEGNFDDASFDRADLTGCEFVRSSFRNASFLNANLTGASFEDSPLAGARYNCATRLPDDFDPAAAGMVNVEESCSPPAP